MKKIKETDVLNLESIQLTVQNGGDCEVYIFNFNNSHYVISSHKKIVGTMKEWNEEGEVPDDYKTNDNLVSDPKIGFL